jgi:hypothetical protein
VLQDKGAGGLDDLASRFADDQAQYAYIRVISGDQESRRTKFIFISWCGESVGALKRAKMSVHKASVKQVIKVLIPISPVFDSNLFSSINMFGLTAY